METLETFTDACNAYGHSTTLIVLSSRFEQKALIPKTDETSVGS